MLSVLALKKRNKKEKKRKRKGGKKKTKPRGTQTNKSKLCTFAMNSQYTGEAARILLLGMNDCQNISFAKAVRARALPLFLEIVVKANKNP